VTQAFAEEKRRVSRRISRVKVEKSLKKVSERNFLKRLLNFNTRNKKSSKDDTRVAPNIERAPSAMRPPSAKEKRSASPHLSSHLFSFAEGELFRRRRSVRRVPRRFSSLSPCTEGAQALSRGGLSKRDAQLSRDLSREIR